MAKPFQSLHQMCCHSLERQNLSVLTLMGFQLVPLGEVLSTASMFTLEDTKTDRKPQTTYKKSHTKRGPNQVIVPDIAVPAYRERGPCGSSCWRS